MDTVNCIDKDRISVGDIKRALSRYSDDEMLTVSVGTFCGAGGFRLYTDDDDLVFKADEW